MAKIAKIDDLNIVLFYSVEYDHQELIIQNEEIRVTEGQITFLPNTRLEPMALLAARLVYSFKTIPGDSAGDAPPLTCIQNEILKQWNRS